MLVWGYKAFFLRTFSLCFSAIWFIVWTLFSSTYFTADFFAWLFFKRFSSALLGVCVCARWCPFYPLQLLDGHLNFWLLADFIVFNETDSCCCRWSCFLTSIVVVLILHCTRTLTWAILLAGFGFQITRHLFSSGHSLKPI